MKVYRDCKGREIKPGDLLKVPHFKAGRQNIFMHKLVARVNDDGFTDPNGKHLYAFDLVDASLKWSLEDAFKCPLSFIESCEIIDSSHVDKTDKGDIYWWERKRAKE